jgi:hypothetical protein
VVKQFKNEINISVFESEYDSMNESLQNNDEIIEPEVKKKGY